MGHPSTIVFDSTLPSPDRSFWERHGLLLFIGGALIIWLLLGGLSEWESPLVYIIGAIIGFYAALFLIIRFLRRKVLRLMMDQGMIVFTYRRAFMTSEHIGGIVTTSIELYELKDSRAGSMGFTIRFKDEEAKRSFRLLGRDWGYHDMEAIYTEFKRGKGEIIPEHEARVFNRLQFLSGTTTKDMN